MEIEKGIPIPKRGSILSKGKYDFLALMDVGDSILIVDNGEIKNFRSHAHRYAEMAGVKVATRKVEGGLRVWRTQ